MPAANLSSRRQCFRTLRLRRWSNRRTSSPDEGHRDVARQRNDYTSAPKADSWLVRRAQSASVLSFDQGCSRVLVFSRHVATISDWKKACGFPAPEDGSV